VGGTLEDFRETFEIIEGFLKGREEKLFEWELRSRPDGLSEA
jgi:hypothetical protein